ncbi:MAG: nitroreductase family protein [Erysipelotrichaceae bacterium]|nr:nitroreductase family protein [Erysipelotrichaceae bacterium]
MVDYSNLLNKRRSSRHYLDESFSNQKMEMIKDQLAKLKPLGPKITTRFVITDRDKTKAKFGRYSLLAYSEVKPGYLLNIGYMLEQFDLLMNANDIGTCWYGLAKEDNNLEGLSFVIMIVFGKTEENLNQDRTRINRKSKDLIWQGDFDARVKEMVCLAPSAVNSQPWRFISEKNTINVYRQINYRTFIPISKRLYFNTIDVGISLCFLEIALTKLGYNFTRRLIHGESDDEKERLVEYAIL